MSHNPSEHHAKSLAQRYENMRAKGESIYLDVDDFESLIEYYLLSEDNATAAELIDLALSIHPRNDLILLKRAAWLLQVERAEEALALIDTLPKNEDSELMRASVYLALSRTEEALAIFRGNLCEKDCDGAGYCYDVSDVLIHYELYKEAREFIDKGLDLNPKMADLYRQAAVVCFLLGDKESCIPYFKRLLDEYPYDVNAWTQLGSLYLDLNRFQEAANALEFAEAASSTPDLAVCVDLGHTYGRLSEYEKAVDVYLQAFEILSNGEDSNVGQSDIAGCIAESYEHLGNLEQALVWYRKTLEINPEDDRACIGIAFCLAQQNQSAEAMHYYEKALELNPENKDIWIGIAELLVGIEQYDAAIVAYKQALEGNADPNEDIWFALACLYFQLGDFSQALDIYLPMIDRGVRMQRLNLCVALCYAMLDEPLESEYYLKQAISEDANAKKIYEEILESVSNLGSSS